MHKRNRILLVLLLTAIGVTGVVLLLNWPAPPVPEPKASPLAEVPLSQLERRDEVLYSPGQTNPFTGFIVEFYVSEILKSRSLVSNGLLNGLSEGWHTNGQKSVSEQFTDGISHGQRSKWYPSGAKLSEASIVDGVLHGPFRRWHENGVLAEAMELRNGQGEGVARSYFPSGFLKVEVVLRNGTPEDTRHWRDGELWPAGVKQ